MKVRSWLAGTCSTSAKDSGIPPRNNHFQSPKHPSSSSSDSSIATSSSDTSSVSLQSDLSIQTLPSVPSLQKISLDPVTVSSYLVTTLNPRPNRPITCLAVHNGFLYAASGHEINVYDQTDYAHLDAFNGNDTGSVKSVALSDGKIFTAHQDSKIRVWKMTAASKQHSVITSLPTRSDKFRRFFLPKNYVTVRRHKQALWIQHVDAVACLAVRNGFLYSVSWDKTLKIWRLSDLRCLESVKAHEDAVNAVAVSGDWTVYTGSADRKIRVWAKPCGEKRHALVATLEKHKSAVNALALSDDGSVLFSGACDRSILVWEREDSANYMAVVGALRGHGKAILSLVNVRDLLFSGSADRTVRIWQRGYDGKYSCLNVLDGHNKPVKSLTAVEDESNGVVSVFSGSLDGEIKVWHVSGCSRSSSPEDGLSLIPWENYGLK